MTALLIALLLVQEDKAKAEEEAKKKDAEAKAKVEAFDAALRKAKKDDDVIAAIEKLGETQHARCLEALKPWLSKGSKDIRIAAAEQVSKYAKDKAAGELLITTALKCNDTDVMIKCIRYAGDVGYRGIADRLVRLFDHKTVEVAQEAVDSCGKIKAKSVIAPLIDLSRRMEAIKDEKDEPGPAPGPGPGPIPGPAPAPDKKEEQKRKKALLPAALGALSDITSEKFDTAKKWGDWWSKNEKKWKEPE
jgi:hypothetical protein